MGISAVRGCSRSNTRVGPSGQDAVTRTVPRVSRLPLLASRLPSRQDLSRLEVWPGPLPASTVLLLARGGSHRALGNGDSLLATTSCLAYRCKLHFASS